MLKKIKTDTNKDNKILKIGLGSNPEIFSGKIIIGKIIQKGIR